MFGSWTKNERGSAIRLTCYIKKIRTLFFANSTASAAVILTFLARRSGPEFFLDWFELPFGFSENCRRNPSN